MSQISWIKKLNKALNLGQKVIVVGTPEEEGFIETSWLISVTVVKEITWEEMIQDKDDCCIETDRLVRGFYSHLLQL